MGADSRFQVIHARAGQAVDELSCCIAELDQEISDLRAKLEALSPYPKVYYRYNRCSTACTCNDNRGHGPYAYISFRDERGRVRKRYLGRDPELPKGTIVQGAYREMEQRLAQLRAERDRLWGRIGRALDLLELAARSGRVIGDGRPYPLDPEQSVLGAARGTRDRSSA